MKNKNFLFNKSAIIIMLIATFLFITNLSITADGDHNKTIQEVIKEIRNELNLNNNDKIDPDKVPESLLEELGEAVMSEIHPNESEHEWMDDMMGGEGSTSLKTMHITMGYRYLEGYYNNVYRRYNGWKRGYGRHIMMAPFSMMGSDRNFRFPGNLRNWFFNFRWIGGITMIIFWLIILGFIGYLIYAAATKNTKSKNQEENPLDIIKKRYALGEITKKEYEEKKKDIL
jgi:uncharacterized membrane protein